MRRLLIAVLALGAIVAILMVLRTWYPPVEGGWIQVQPDPRLQPVASELRRRFLDSESPGDRYADLFRYFVAGFIVYRSADGARAHYPGAGSVHGRSVDGLEGYSRLAPLLAAWLAGGRSAQIDIDGLGTVDLLGLLQDGLASGTDPEAAGYWGNIRPGTQTMMEAGDIALALWLSRDRLWPKLDPQVRTNISNWLAATRGRERSRHLNWRLIPVIVNRVLRGLGAKVPANAVDDDWAAIKAGYLGQGWFQDREQADYYNAWGFHYSLYWLTQIDPALDAVFIDRARAEFVRFFRHLITPKGLPILGRSICYRTAAPAPLIADAISASPSIGPGEARRALDAVWRYFVEHGALANGNLTQGYCGADLRLLDRYSGPASCLWGLRSLVLAFSVPDDAPFWTAAMQPLPVEVDDFTIEHEPTGWRVEGRRSELTVAIHRPVNGGTPAIKPMRWYHRLAESWFERPFRPRNGKAKYQGTRYSSDPPFCGCLE